MKNSFVLFLLFLQTPVFASAVHKEPNHYEDMASPLIIAHRGGNLNWPENTLCAFKHDVEIGVDAIELDVQVTKDRVAVVYHPEDLSKWTAAKGPVADKTAKEVTALDTTSKYQGNSEYKSTCTPEELKIPKLSQVFAQIPSKTPIIIDFKSLPAGPLVDAVLAQIPEADLRRTIFYSTSKEHLDVLKKRNPGAAIFEDRETTLKRLLTLRESKHRSCEISNEVPWVGFEISRPLKVCDTTKLGDSCVQLEFDDLWTKAAVKCTERQTHANIVFFGVDSKTDYEKARQWGATAVYTNNPLMLVQEKSKQASR